MPALYTYEELIFRAWQLLVDIRSNLISKPRKNDNCKEWKPRLNLVYITFVLVISKGKDVSAKQMLINLQMGDIITLQLNVLTKKKKWWHTYYIIKSYGIPRSVTLMPKTKTMSYITAYLSKPGREIFVTNYVQNNYNLSCKLMIRDLNNRFAASILKIKIFYFYITWNLSGKNIFFYFTRQFARTYLILCRYFTWSNCFFERIQRINMQITVCITAFRFQFLQGDY